MAQLVLGVAGAAVGSLFGVPQLGWMIGVGLGSAFAPKQKFEAPQLEDLRLPRVDLGQPVTWVAGSPQVTGNVIYTSIKRPIKHTEEAGGKNGGGAESSYWTYEIDVYIKLSENQIAGVSRVWKNGDLIYGDGITRNGIWAEMRVYTGEEGQLPDPDFEAAEGAEKAQAHLGCGAVFIKSLQLDSGGNMPVLKFEVGTAYARDYSVVKHLIRATGGGSGLVDSSIYAWSPTLLNDASIVGDGVVNSGSYGGVALGNSTSLDDFPVWHGDYTVEIEFSMGEPDGFPTQNWYLFILDTGDTGRAPVRCRIQKNSSELLNVEVGDGVSSKIHILGTNVHTPMIGVRQTLLVMRVENVVICYLNEIELFRTTYDATKYNFSTNEFIVGSRFDLSGHLIGTWGTGELRSPVEITNFRFAYAAMYEPLSSVVLQRPLQNYQQITATGEFAPVALDQVVSDLMLRAGYTAAQFDVTALASITKPVRGLAIGRLTNTRSVLELLAQTHWFTWQKRGFQIVFLPRVEDVAASIPFDDLGVSTSATSDRTPLEFQFASELELPAQVSVTYPNVLNDYQPDTQLSDHFLSQQQSVENIELAVGMTPTEAKAVADAIQIERLAAMGKASVTVPLKWLAIEPNDVVNLYDQAGREYRVRVGDVKDHGLYLEWDVVLDDVRATLSAGITDGGSTGQSTVQQMALTEWMPLDMPLIRDADNNPGWWVAAAPGVGDLWPGAAVLGSWDGVSFSKLADTTDAAVFGETTTVLGNWTGGNVFDTTNSVTVSINGEASSYTRAAMLADLSLGVWLIGSEVIRARTATLVSAGVYRLSNLIRGFRGTAWAMGTHMVGERAVLINSALRRVATQQSHIGLERQIKAITAGLAQTTATAEAFTDTGIALKPFAPVNLKGAWDVGTGDLALTWRRHPRLSHRFLTPGIEPPLGETSELYDVEIWDTGFTTLKHTFSSVTAPSQTYTAAQQTTDFGAPQSSVGVRVYQRSEAVGRGYQLQGVV